MEIIGVDTSTAALIGQTGCGPSDPCLVADWADYQRWYGGHNPAEAGFLSYAVEGFFANGGQRLYVTRVTGAGAVPAWVDLAGLRVEAIGPGSWGDRLYARLSQHSSGARLAIRRYSHPQTWLALIINRSRPDLEEVYENLTPANAAEVVNGTSHLVKITLRPEGFRRLRRLSWFRPLTRGSDGAAPGIDDYERALISLEIRASIVTSPDTDIPGLAGLNERLVQFCESSRDCFTILSNSMEQPLPTASSFTALYTPWIGVSTPLGTRLVPPVGHLAGIYARVTREQGVQKAPANEELAGAVDVSEQITQEHVAELAVRGIDTIRDFRLEGGAIRVWGARTLSQDPEWKYVNVRRLFIFLEHSIDQGLQFAAFEPNGEELWSRVRALVNDFLFNQWKNGLLQGAKPEEAFFVRCDRSTMTQEDIDNGRLVCMIGVAAVRPAEFVIFRIGAKTADDHP